jgi:hypothetical protein
LHPGHPLSPRHPLALWYVCMYVCMYL